MQYPLTAEEFDSIYSRVPRASVDIVVRHKGGVVLTLRTLRDWKDLWHIPGSTIRLNESAEDAARRTGREELGVDLRPLHTLGYIEYLHANKSGGVGHSVSIVILCEIVSGEPVADGAQASSAQVFARTELPSAIIAEQGEFLRTHAREIFTP